MGRNPRRVNLSSLELARAEIYRVALDVVSLMRRHPRYSLASAAREFGTTPTTVKRYAGSALVKRRGRFRATGFDRLPRELQAHTTRGSFPVMTRSSKAASVISQHHHAIRAYIYHGDPSALEALAGKTVTVGGERYQLLTDTRAINRLARAGALKVDDIYGGGA